MTTATAIPSASFRKPSLHPLLLEIPEPEELLRGLLKEQSTLRTAVGEFADWHEKEPLQARYYKSLIPLNKPGAGEQYAFEVDLDRCTGCKACVVACHGLNGLDDNETWRDMGLIVAPAVSYQQTVTTACHHCADPACLNGCPVLAYDKNEETGIVSHLDDQCIGCSYCILKCPYDVPKYNKKRGIVRKCDMCQGRLAAGEAPACVQGCPTEAIAIRVVKRDVARTGSLMPGSVPSSYTSPTTRYVSERPIPAMAAAANSTELRVEDAHWPLVLMLVLTQAATGCFGASILTGKAELNWAGLAVLMLGMSAAGAHLGQPLKAWRAWMGWRRSWLSREIIAFSALMPAAGGAALGLIPATIPFLIGLLSVFTSVMVYVDTKRPAWNLPETAVKFFGTTAVLGLFTASMMDGRFRYIAEFVAALKLFFAAFSLLRNPDNPVVKISLGPLRSLTASRILTSAASLVLLWITPAAALVCAGVGELLERILFFKSGKAWRMPSV